MRIDIWDMGGQERFKNISKNYYKDVYTVIFVFDVNIKKITEKIKIRLNDANENMAKNTVKVLIWNIIDREGVREVNVEQMKVLRENTKWKFLKLQ